MRLANTTVLLTGACGGIGRAIAEQLSQAGCRLILVGRNAEALEALLQHLSDQSHRCLVADITREKGRAKLIEQAQAEKVSLLINAAGTQAFGLLEQQQGSDIHTTLETNLVAPMLLCQALIPTLKEQPEAAIVNIGSIFGSIGHPGFSAYCASKAGLRGFSEALARELADTSVNVLYLAPRATATAFNSEAVIRLNKALGNRTDSPTYVAQQLVRSLIRKQPQSFLGWPEKFFVKLNALFPALVHQALVKKLPIVKHFASQQTQ